MTQALTYVEVDLPRCSRTYGVAPCTAAIGVTGSIKCFNSIKTCQDRENFAEQTETIRFALSSTYLPPDIDCIPSINAVEITPAIISLGENLGERATVKVTFIDHRHSDTGVGGDRYLSGRSYDPWGQGTYWAKFRARHPFLRGRALRLIRGQVGQAISQMETRHYVIESLSGPTIDGIFTIVAKDVLKLAAGDRAVAPALSNGFLASDITNVATSASLSPAGIGDAEYPASGYAAIGGSEICAFTRSGNTLTLTRAQFNTAAKAHTAQDRVQLCLSYSSEDAADIIADLMINYAAVPSSYVEASSWLAETAAFLGVVYSALICEPTPVETLISELITEAALAVWWNDLSQKVRLQVLRNIDTTAVLYDASLWLADSLGIEDQPDKRLSRVQIYFARINPLRPLTDLDNYRSSAEIVDTDAESDYGSQQIKTITSRWIPALGRTVAETAARKLLARYRDPPRRFKFRLPRYAGIIEPVLGLGCRLGAGALQDATGELAIAPIQITQLKSLDANFDVVAQEVLFTALPDAPVDRVIVIDFNTYNFNLRAAHDSLFPAPQSGDEVTCRIEIGIVVGSASVALPAFDVGTWPSGVAIKIILHERIQGAGGAGGNGQNRDYSGLTAGQAGGIALYTRYPIEIEYGAGAKIWSGGGGGGGGNNRLPGSALTSGGGAGGGGAGTSPGGAGINGIYAVINSYSAAGTSLSGGPGSDVNGAVDGGPGGGPGLPGTASSSAGGAAGSAIDGLSYVMVTSGTADIRGPQIN